MNAAAGKNAAAAKASQLPKAPSAHSELRDAAARVTFRGMMEHFGSLAGLTLVFVFAGFVKGVIGMGLPTVAMGFLTLLMAPAEAATILVLPSFVTNVWQLAAGPQLPALLRRLWPTLLAVTVGTVAAAQWFGAVSSAGTLAALGAVLKLYRRSPDLARALPTLRWLTRPLAEMELIGRSATGLLREALGAEYEIELADSTAEVGSGALPTVALPSKVLAIRHPTHGPGAIAARFRAAMPPIVGRIQDDRFLLDLRGIFDPAVLVPRN
jgi:hypothetical protein